MTGHPAGLLALAIADQLAAPATAPWPVGTEETTRRQSLARGAPGIALLHIELAARGIRPWERAHTWLVYAAARPLIAGRGSHPNFGTYALAYALSCAAEALPGTYERALAALDAPIIADTRARLAAARARIDRGQAPRLAEFDMIRGLSGVGMRLLRRSPDGSLVKEVLRYVVKLTEPIEELPGWWTGTGLSGRADPDFPDGHGNNGMAHGVAGPLALLAAAELAGVSVPGQREAIAVILAWYDRWLAATGSSAGWPYWIGVADLSRPPATIPASRPSWCYGAAGIARAHQLAGLALTDVSRQAAAERTLIGALSDPAQLALVGDPTICHGHGGLVHIAATAATDAPPANAGMLTELIPALLSAVHPADNRPHERAEAVIATHGPHFLDGAAGIALAVLSAALGDPPHTGWDRCLATTSPKGIPRP